MEGRVAPEGPGPSGPDPGPAGGSVTEGVRRFRRLLTGVGRFLDEIVRRPDLRRLRWVLLVGLLIELLLAPITSWAGDTPSFVQTAEITLTTGNPYAGGVWFNPPLPPYLDLPILAIAGWITGGAPANSYQIAFRPLAEHAGLSMQMTAPWALMAWKLPLIVANLVTALGLVALLREVPRFRGRTEWVAAAWMLNPVVIWSTAVHGEVDALAVALVIVSIVALSRRLWWVSGALLGLAILSKGYPLVLVLPVAAYLLAASVPGLSVPRERLRALAGWIAGLVVAFLPFVALLANLAQVLTAKVSYPLYGALSVLIIFNVAAPKGVGAYQAFSTNLANAAAILQFFEVLGVLAVLVGTIALALRLRRRGPSDASPAIFLLAAAGAWAVVGLLIADPSPEAENLLDVLSLLILAAPVLTGRRFVALGLGITITGIVQYWALASPAAFFAPLALLLGTGGIDWVNGWTVAYVSSSARGAIWLVIGLAGGSMLLLLWASTGWRVLPKRERARIRAWFQGPSEGSDG